MASPEAVEWVSCCCSRCDTKLFEVQNIWIRVTPTYVTLSSVVGGLYLRDIAAVVTNELEWDGANELLGCKLRKLTCGSCGKSIGVECVRASTQSQQYQYE